MNAQLKAASRIAELLHRSRCASWTSDHCLELSAAMRNQPPEVLACALLEFSQSMLRASRQVVTTQINAAIVEQVLAERDAGGTIQ